MNASRGETHPDQRDKSVGQRLERPVGRRMPEGATRGLRLRPAPAGDGWFVVSVRDAQWPTAESRAKKPPGSVCVFESGDFSFPKLGIKLRVLEPGQPNSLYHSENQQEAFLVLSGGCRLPVEGEERLLGRWDFFHSPPGPHELGVRHERSHCRCRSRIDRSGPPSGDILAQATPRLRQVTTDLRLLLTFRRQASRS